MSIAATTHDSQRVSALDADIDRLARDMNLLHETAHSIGNDDERQRFAQLEHIVDWRLNQLASVLAAQDTWHSNTSQP